MAETNLFQELKDVLQELKDFLDGATDAIRGAVQALVEMGVPIVQLIDLLVNLLNQLKAEVQKFDTTQIPGLAEVGEFSGKVTGVLEASKAILPDDLDDDVDQVLEVASVVTGLPSLDEIKAEIVGLLEAVVDDLNSLKPA